MPNPMNAAALLQQLGQIPAVQIPAIAPEQFAEERAAWSPPPQPQHLVLQLPPDLSACWADECDILKQYDANGQLVVNTTGAPMPWPNRPGAFIQPNEPIPAQAWPGDPGIRVVLVFDSVNVLKIVQDQGRGGSHVGEPLTTRFSYRERNLARKGEAPRLASDAAHLYRALFANELTTGTVPRCDLRLGDNEAFVRTMVQFGPNRKFEADWEWSARCNPNRTSRMLDPQTKQFVDRNDPRIGQPIPGCGHAVYQRDWPRDPQTGLLLEQITCPGVFPAGTPWAGSVCGAVLSPFGNLRRFALHAG